MSSAGQIPWLESKLDSLGLLDFRVLEPNRLGQSECGRGKGLVIYPHPVGTHFDHVRVSIFVPAKVLMPRTTTNSITIFQDKEIIH